MDDLGNTTVLPKGQPKIAPPPTKHCLYGAQKLKGAPMESFVMHSCGSVRPHGSCAGEIISAHPLLWVLEVIFYNREINQCKLCMKFMRCWKIRYIFMCFFCLLLFHYWKNSTRVLFFFAESRRLGPSIFSFHFRFIYLYLFYLSYMSISRDLHQFYFDH